ncbi:hypothetical protein Avbf_10339 [Armadillidium vulgare]|nr:hypothetical protein Avbf_10339 [Armadillidium vulgare]
MKTKVEIKREVIGFFNKQLGLEPSLELTSVGSIFLSTKLEANICELISSLLNKLIKLTSLLLTLH